MYETCMLIQLNTVKYLEGMHETCMQLFNCISIHVSYIPSSYLTVLAYMYHAFLPNTVK